jgi:RNA polymerase sigma-70 factor (ECF subfamily)
METSAEGSLRAAQPFPSAPSDKSLLRRFQHGDQDAATLLFLRYAHRLRALARQQCGADLNRRLDAEDIVQSVFRYFFHAARRGYYDVPEGQDLWKLFLVIALNKIRAQGAFHRAARRDVRLTEDLEACDQSPQFRHQHDKEAYTVLHLVIEDILARLPAPHRRMVELRIDGYEVADIARQSNRSKRTVERVLQEFRHQLGALLNEDD